MPEDLTLALCGPALRLRIARIESVDAPLGDESCGGLTSVYNLAPRHGSARTRRLGWVEAVLRLSVCRLVNPEPLLQKVPLQTVLNTRKSRIWLGSQQKRTSTTKARLATLPSEAATTQGCTMKRRREQGACARGGLYPSDTSVAHRSAA